MVLPKKEIPPILGESRQTAVKCYRQNEQSLLNWPQFETCVLKYPQLGHAEKVPADDLWETPVHDPLRLVGALWWPGRENMSHRTCHTESESSYTMIQVSHSFLVEGIYVDHVRMAVILSRGTSY